MSGSMRNAGRLSVPVGRYHFSLKSHTIEITDNTPDGLDIDGNSITFKKSGIINLNIHQEAIIPYRPINRNISLNVSQAPLQIDGGNAGRLSVPVGRYHFSLKSHKGIFVAYHDCIERLVALVLSPHAEFAVASVRSKLSERTE